MLCGTGSLIVRPVRDRATAPYIRHVLSRPDMKARLLRSSLGTTLPNLNRSIVAKLKIAVPAIERQQEFGSRLARAELLKADLQRQGEHLDGLFASLQQRAFAGEL